MNYYEEIKHELINNEIKRKVKNYSINKNDLSTYYNVGKMLSEAGKHYGDGIIKEYSLRLSNDLNIKYDSSSLNKMKKFYLLAEKMATLSPNLSYSHYVELLSIDDRDEIKYYIELVEKNNLSIRELRRKIRNNEYERLPITTKKKINNNDKLDVKDLIPDPIIIKNGKDKELVSEKVLHDLILEDIESFMKELGNGFSFIGSEYKIKLGDRFNYIDLLLFNYEFNCFVVVELKTIELKKEHIGQLEVYMNYIDKNIKKIYHDKTIGIIICKRNNQYVIEYSSDFRIISREYKLM